MSGSIEENHQVFIHEKFVPQEHVPLLEISLNEVMLGVNESRLRWQNRMKCMSNNNNNCQSRQFATTLIKGSILQQLVSNSRNLVKWYWYPYTYTYVYALVKLWWSKFMGGKEGIKDQGSSVLFEWRFGSGRADKTIHQKMLETPRSFSHEGITLKRKYTSLEKNIWWLSYRKSPHTFLTSHPPLASSDKANFNW